MKIESQCGGRQAACFISITCCFLVLGAAVASNSGNWIQRSRAGRTAPARKIARLQKGARSEMVVRIDQSAGAETATRTKTVVRKRIKFDFEWKFFKGDQAGAYRVDFEDSSWRMVNLPHDWSIEGPFSSSLASGTGYLPGGTGWYRKSFKLAGKFSGKITSIEFDGVYMNSKVWINGKYLGKRPYGYSSFQYDLTPYLNFGDKLNVIAVRVDHSKYIDSRWYTGSGIYRHVWLVSCDKIHVSNWGTFVTTPQVSKDGAMRAAAVRICTRVKNETHKVADINLVSMIRSVNSKKIIAVISNVYKLKAKKENDFTQVARIKNISLWSPESPNLYELISHVKKGGSVVDDYVTVFGIRTFHFDANHGFFLNGRGMKIKGVCLHHDAGCLGAAVPDRALKRRLEILKGLGCNAIRTSHNPPAPELLDFCDRLGFFVMDEAFDEWELGKRKWIVGWNVGRPGLDGYHEYFKEWSGRDLQTMILRDRNHASIILWSIGNEIDYPGDPYSYPGGRNYNPFGPSAKRLPLVARRLVKIIKELDTTRPVTAALADAVVSSVTGYADVLDVVGYNYQESLYAKHHVEFPKRIIFGSENGDSLAAWLAVKKNDYISGQFLWTGFDFLGEAGRWPWRGSRAGLVDLCGFIKPIGFFRKCLWTSKPMVYISPGWGRRRLKRNEVLCFSNCGSVELFFNGKSLGVKKSVDKDNPSFKWNNIPRERGVLKAVGKTGGKAVCSFELHPAGKASAIVLKTDQNHITSDGQDLCHVEVNVVDTKGNIVPSADNKISFSISGKGRIIGVGSGDQESHEDYKAKDRKAFHGRCLVIIESERTPGMIKLTALSEGLLPAELTVTSD